MIAISCPGSPGPDHHLIHGEYEEREVGKKIWCNFLPHIFGRQCPGL
jgi:hypothetical protein